MSLHRLATAFITSMLASFSLPIYAIPILAEQASAPLTGKINISTAIHRELVMLPGIDESLSPKIVRHRKRHKFTRIEDILKVARVDREVYARIKSFIIVEGKTTLRLTNR